MHIPTDVLRNILLNITDVDHFKNVCDSRSDVSWVCLNTHGLNELFKRLRMNDSYIIYKVNSHIYEVKELFKSRDFENIKAVVYIYIYGGTYPDRRLWGM